MTLPTAGQLGALAFAALSLGILFGLPHTPRMDRLIWWSGALAILLESMKWGRRLAKKLLIKFRLRHLRQTLAVLTLLLIAGCSDLAGGLIYLDWLAASVTTTIREDWGGGAVSHHWLRRAPQRNRG